MCSGCRRLAAECLQLMIPDNVLPPSPLSLEVAAQPCHDSVGASSDKVEDCLPVTVSSLCLTILKNESLMPVRMPAGGVPAWAALVNDARTTAAGWPLIDQPAAPIRVLFSCTAVRSGAGG